jgi:surface-anchored protein
VPTREETTMNSLFERALARPRVLIVAPAVAMAATLGAACVPVTPPATTTTTTTTIPGPVELSEGHVDGPGIAFEGGAFDVHVHDEETDTEYAPDEVVLVAKDEAATTVPTDPAFDFLGDDGAPIWVLPQVEDPELLYLGYAAEEIADGVFEGDSVELRLISVDGPGSFHLYQNGLFGDPEVLFDSDDALPQAIGVSTGSHNHANWVFGAEGDYTITYEVVGTPVGDVEVSSGPVEFSYRVGS